MATLQTPAAKAAPKPRHPGWPAAIAIVFCLFLLIGGGLAFYVIRGFFGYADKAANAPESFGKALAQNFSPTVTYTTEINSALGEIKHTPKLIVNTYEIDVEIKKAASSNWGYIYWGTTDVMLRAHKNKVQYYVPVESLTTGNFSYDPQTKILHATIPLPRLDEDVVEVQSDPTKIEVRTDLGWAQSDAGTGKPLRDAAQSDLRAAVIAAGKGEAQQALAEKDAKKTFTRLLDPVVKAIGPDATIDIQFQSTP